MEILREGVYKCVKKMVNKKRCYKCNKFIQPDEKFATLNTYDGGKCIDETFWHWQCWLDYFKECVEKKVKNLAKFSIRKVVPMMKEIIAGGLSG